jgi:hypothetical protein
MTRRFPLFPPTCGRFTDISNVGQVRTDRLPISEPLWPAAEVARERGIYLTAKTLHLEWGKPEQSFHLFDRGYLQSTLDSALTRICALFITRTKKIIQSHRRSSHHVERSTKVG